MAKDNRFLASNEAMEDVTTSDSLFKIAAGGVASGLAGYWLGLKAIESIGGPATVPLFLAILAPVLFTFSIIAYAQIITAGDIKAEAIEAIEKANDAIANANVIASDADAYHLMAKDMQTLLEEKQTLSEKLQTLELQFSDMSIRNAELLRSLESEKANAAKRIEQAQADAEDRALKEVAPYMEKAKTLENRAKTAETKLALMEEAIGYKRKSASANGRMSQAGSNEEAKANAKSERDGYLAQYNAALKANPFLYEILEAKA